MKRFIFAFSSLGALASVASSAVAQVETPQVVEGPAPAPAAVAPAPAAQPATNARKSAFATKVQLGGAYRSFSKIPVLGGELGVSLGAMGERFAVYWDFDVFRGSTESGLLMWTARSGVAFLGRIDRLQLGGGPQFTYLAISRATTSDWFNTSSFGVFVMATVDLLTFGDEALYIGAKAHADGVWGSGNGQGTGMAGVNASLGYRF